MQRGERPRQNHRQIEDLDSFEQFHSAPFGSSRYSVANRIHVDPNAILAAEARG